MTITGKKGGSSESRTPVESPDSLQSTAFAKILLALGEGEWEGGIDGTQIYLDNTPIQNPDGTINFPGVTWEFRPGTQHQNYIPGIPAAENEINVGVELKSSTPWVRSVTNTQLSAVRLRFGWPSLQMQNAANGDIGGYRVDYAIDVATDGGAYKEVLRTSVIGKTKTLYERSHRVDLPPSTSGWMIRVRRLTVNAASSMISDLMHVQAITEVIDAKLRYPNTALLFVQFNAQQFSSIPLISVEKKMRIIRIPSNYDPINRTYLGVWDGTFKWAWTNNPAWVFYDILLSSRFGVGNRLNSSHVDKWELYRIAQYCDQLVPDGRGGTEPRYLCDVYIQSQAEAWTVIRDISAIFRGMVCWADSQVLTLADMPRDMDYIYHRANVIDGKFSYSGTPDETHYSTAMVAWSNPENNYQDEVEPVSELPLIRRYGVNSLDITAIGCVRQSEANRRGRWALLTNDADRSVTFSVGLDGKIPLPGRIIGIADPLLAGRTIGGRISKVNGRSITFDRIPDAKSGDRLILNLPSGKAEARTIQSVSSQTVIVTSTYSEDPQEQCIWAIDADDLFLQQFRVIGIAENSDGNARYTITAVQCDPDKYERIDTGARIDDRPISIVPPSIQPAPTNIQIGSFSSIEQGIAITTLSVAWDPSESAIAYEAQWRKDNGNWISVQRTSMKGFEVPNIYAGRYLVRVRAINVSEISSVWAISDEVYIAGKEGAPPALVAFRTEPILFGITLVWGFQEGSEDGLKTEVWYNTVASDENYLLLADVPYPQRSHTLQGLRAGQEFWFKARLIDKTGNDGPWTSWTRGMASTDTDIILDQIKDDVMSSTAGKQLMSEMDMSAEAIIENALANDASVRRWRKQSGDMRAEIYDVRETIITESEATAKLIEGVQSQIGENSAAIERRAETVVTIDGDVSATYSIKLGAQKNGVFYGAGMAIGVESTDSGVETQVLFNANRFAFLNDINGSISTPFAVENGQTFIDSAFIADASITNAKIGDYIRSDNFVSDKSGWQLSKNGGLQINGSGESGGRMQVSNDRIDVIDEKGVLRVRMGKLRD